MTAAILLTATCMSDETTEDDDTDVDISGNGDNNNGRNNGSDNEKGDFWQKVFHRCRCIIDILFILCMLSK